MLNDDTGSQARAACRDEDPELFFPVGSGKAAKAQIAEAKAVCVFCPVKAGCLRWALDNGIDHGVWGGTTPTERRDLRKAELDQQLRRLEAELDSDQDASVLLT